MREASACSWRKPGPFHTIHVSSFKIWYRRHSESIENWYVLYSYKPMLKAIRARVAELVGADVDECVIVQNATHGINTVLRNFEWKHEDILVGSMLPASSIFLAFTQPSFTISCCDIPCCITNHSIPHRRPTASSEIRLYLPIPYLTVWYLGRISCSSAEHPSSSWPQDRCSHRFNSLGSRCATTLERDGQDM